jgi:hypothetical protein
MPTLCGGNWRSPVPVVNIPARYDLRVGWRGTRWNSVRSANAIALGLVDLRTDSRLKQSCQASHQVVISKNLTPASRMAGAPDWGIPVILVRRFMYLPDHSGCLDKQTWIHSLHGNAMESRMPRSAPGNASAALGRRRFVLTCIACGNGDDSALLMNRSMMCNSMQGAPSQTKGIRPSASTS